MTETTATQNSSSYDIVIVGGGMVGISLALLLAEQQHPWKVLLLEAQAYQQSDKLNIAPALMPAPRLCHGAAARFLKPPACGRHCNRKPAILKKFMLATAVILA